MTKNPFVNALVAALYIAGVVSVLSLFVDSEVERTMPLIVPITMLSLFSISVAVMGLTFFYQPFQMYFDGQKKQAVTLAFQTVGVFAVITVALVATLLLSASGAAI